MWELALENERGRTPPPKWKYNHGRPGQWVAGGIIAMQGANSFLMSGMGREAFTP